MKKPLHFNKSQIKKILGDINTEYLFLAGQTIRTKARQSLKVGGEKNGKREHSKAGDVPKLSSAKSPLKSLILYAFDPVNFSMVVGSSLFEARKPPEPAPRVLERGGSVTVKRKIYKPANKRNWGAGHNSGTRPENYSYFRTKETRDKAVQSSGFKGWTEKQKPTYKTEQITVEPRPYMSRALKQVLSANMSKWLYQKAVSRVSK